MFISSEYHGTMAAWYSFATRLPLGEIFFINLLRWWSGSCHQIACWSWVTWTCSWTPTDESSFCVLCFSQLLAKFQLCQQISKHRLHIFLWLDGNCSRYIYIFIYWLNYVAQKLILQKCLKVPNWHPLEYSCAFGTKSCSFYTGPRRLFLFTLKFIYFSKFSPPLQPQRT